MIRAGDLDQRISLFAPGTPVRQMGQVVTPLYLLRKVSAQVREGLGKEFVAAGQVDEQKRVAFRIRFATDLFALGAKMQVEWVERRFEVVSTTGSRASGEMWLHCQSVGVAS